MLFSTSCLFEKDSGRSFCVNYAKIPSLEKGQTKLLYLSYHHFKDVNLEAIYRNQGWYTEWTPCYLLIPNVIGQTLAFVGDVVMAPFKIIYGATTYPFAKKPKTTANDNSQSE
jgi:hypothetical protein